MGLITDENVHVAYAVMYMYSVPRYPHVTFYLII